MEKWSNRLPETLIIPKVENAVEMISTESADFIMAHT
jgi:hypothetical protein